MINSSTGSNSAGEITFQLSNKIKLFFTYTFFFSVIAIVDGIIADDINSATRMLATIFRALEVLDDFCFIFLSPNNRIYK